VRHILIILSILLLSSPVFGQSERPETIIIPVSSMGDVSDTRKQILENTLTDELKKHFRIVPQEKYKRVLEQVFQELEYEECSEDICIMRVQEMLQVENVFNLQIKGIKFS
jgi:DNA integrity scanning protein DisA with diadenylate cyclase activity